MTLQPDDPFVGTQAALMRAGNGVSIRSQQLGYAIDVVAWLTEQAGRMAGKGANELAMSEALSATFRYLVAYLHYLTIDQDEPDDALAKAAAGIPELGACELDFLRLVSMTLGPHP